MCRVGLPAWPGPIVFLREEFMNSASLYGLAMRYVYIYTHTQITYSIDRSFVANSPVPPTGTGNTFRIKSFEH